MGKVKGLLLEMHENPEAEMYEVYFSYIDGKENGFCRIQRLKHVVLTDLKNLFCGSLHSKLCIPIECVDSIHIYKIQHIKRKELGFEDTKI
jgi:hypothetical protein